ncbi:MAG: ATP-binding protein, partial [Myxococcota bacterium]
ATQVRQQLTEERRADVAPMVHAAFRLEGSAQIDASPTLVRIVLGALLMNAYDAVEGSDATFIEVRLREDPVQIEVANDGPAIPETSRAAIFDPFVSSPPHSRFRSGLGLTAAKRLAERYNGTLELIRSDETETRFRFAPGQSKA